MLQLDAHNIGTYARNLIADWPLLTKLIQQETRWIKDTVVKAETASPKIDVLGDQEIDDVFNGPYQAFFKSHLQAQAAITRLEAAHTISTEDYFKESEHHDDLSLGVPKARLAQIDASTLSELRNQLNTLTQEHYNQWQTHQQQWTESLLRALSENKISLNDIELQEFPLNQPASELHDRFVNLHTPLPKLDKSPFDCQQYWILKTTLTVQSALSRMQMPNTEKDIGQALKPLQPVFNTIKPAEMELSKTQQIALKKLLATAGLS